jgi:hypothetical protein
VQPEHKTTPATCKDLLQVQPQSTIPHDGCCPVCGGDCGSANPPMLYCPHGSPDLDEDAAKLLALGADPGPTWDAVDELDRWVFTEEDAGDAG